MVSIHATVAEMVCYQIRLAWPLCKNGMLKLKCVWTRQERKLILEMVWCKKVGKGKCNQRVGKRTFDGQKRPGTLQEQTNGGEGKCERRGREGKLREHRGGRNSITCLFFLIKHIPVTLKQTQRNYNCKTYIYRIIIYYLSNMFIEYR